MKAMTQKIQEFKSLEIPKTHRQLEEVIETIKNTQRKISSANRKLCKLRARLSRKKGAIDIVIQSKLSMLLLAKRWSFVNYMKISRY